MLEKRSLWDDFYFYAPMLTCLRFHFLSQKRSSSHQLFLFPTLYPVLYPDTKYYEDYVLDQTNPISTLIVVHNQTQKAWEGHKRRVRHCVLNFCRFFLICQSSVPLTTLDTLNVYCCWWHIMLRHWVSKKHRSDLWIPNSFLHRHLHHILIFLREWCNSNNDSTCILIHSLAACEKLQKKSIIEAVTNIIGWSLWRNCIDTMIRGCSRSDIAQS
jgi:hypothetical protein